MAFLGYMTRGVQPFKVISREKEVVCDTTADSRVLLIGVGIIFGPLLITQFAMKPEYWTSLSLPMKGVVLFFTAAAFCAIYAGLFGKRQLVFNGTDLSIEFYKGKKLSSKITRDQIRSFGITTEPRQSSAGQAGAVRWTAYIYWVLLANGERQALLESAKEGLINEVGELVRLLFKIEGPVYSTPGGA